MPEYRRNHYVPEWYQQRFLANNVQEKKFYYMDLTPDSISNGRRRYKRKALLRWGPSRCFCEQDLYTTKFGDWQSTEIEEKFFGKIDSAGSRAVEYWSKFEHPSIDPESFQKLLLYMSIQKLRTPKGLDYLAHLVNLSDKNMVLFRLQELEQLFCALWTECIWSIVDASKSETKFLLSDHPVTVYNRGCFPLSKWCRGYRDPDIRFSGTHTLFALTLERMLILTNLSWVRNPYQNPLKIRPNPTLFRPAMFNFMQIQTERYLTELEVSEINYVTKRRARRYIAASEEAWLYPEDSIPSQYWDKLGGGYLFMPDPRSVSFSTELIIGHKDNRRTDFFDEYGRKPWQPDYDDKQQRELEWVTFQAFQGEFARLFGPKRRGRAFEFGTFDREEDDQEYHAYHLGLEGKFKAKLAKMKQR
jgi:hypothetical protein